MADDIQDLGGVDVFPFEPNWSSTPRSSIPLSRFFLQHRATAPEISQMIADVPITVEMGFLMENKQDEDTLLDFMQLKRGKVGRFWLKHPKTSFVLKSNAGLGSTALVCEPNQFNLQYQGYERFYIVMKNEDIITRKITAVQYNDVTEEMTLEFTTPTDRDINVGDIVLWGRVLLVRFDEDTFEINGETDAVSEITLRFAELVQEYSEV